MSRTPVLAALAAAAALTLTACSGGGLGVFGGGGEEGTPGGTGSAPVLSAPQGVYLQANSTADLGTTVIDGVGFTLYRFDQDSANPPKATCEGPCAQTWQPVPFAQPVVLEGVAQNMVGSVARADGSQQVTIGGWPVYRLVGEPTGEVGGHGRDGAWFAIKPDGKKAAKPA
jgi:predicted lipoprotein with Yx(FWY)xxD motif